MLNSEVKRHLIILLELLNALHLYEDVVHLVVYCTDDAEFESVTCIRALLILRTELAYDFNNAEGRKRAWDHITKEEPKLIVDSPECRMFSALQNLSKWNEKKQRDLQSRKVGGPA